MSRIGSNPAKNINHLSDRTECGFATIVYIPMMTGYWSSSLEIAKQCILSARNTAGRPIEIYVFDNGSCKEVVDELVLMHERGCIDVLILSNVNIGKVGGWNHLFTAAANKYLTYSDSDVLFLNGWLDSSLKIIREFKECGIVTAQPVAGGDLSKLWTYEQAIQDRTITVSTGKIIPDEITRAVVQGLGRPHSEYLRRTEDHCDVLISRNGVDAFGTASHFQFSAEVSYLRSIFPAQSSRPLGDDLMFETEAGMKGRWRLATKEMHVYHMGNSIPTLDELKVISAATKSNITWPSVNDNNGTRTSRRSSSFGYSIWKWLHELSYKRLY